MKTTISISILFLTISINSFACECPEYDLSELDIKSYEWSDLVIIGELIKTGANYQIKVREILKGEAKDKIINGTTITEDGVFDGCSMFPKEKGEYLFYLKKTQKNGKTYYLYSQCLGTRRLDFKTVVIPLKTNKTKSELIAQTERWIGELREK